MKEKNRVEHAWLITFFIPLVDFQHYSRGGILKYNMYFNAFIYIFMKTCLYFNNLSIMNF